MPYGHVGAPALDDSPGILLKGDTGTLHVLAYHNTTAADAFIQIFDVAALGSVTLGTTTADFVVPVAANICDNISFPNGGMYFQNGIAIFSTTAHGGSTAAVVDVWAGVG
jgi:hypothetical protein